MKILEVSDLNSHYGLSHILFGASLYVDEGSVVCLLGRNGAGKTTLFRSIMGLAPPRSTGSIMFNKAEIMGKLPFERSRMGLGFAQEDRHIFGNLTVEENLLLPWRDKIAFDCWTCDRVYSLFPILERLRKRKAGQLSGGEQQMLNIARCLMINPKLLLLDEPTEGLAPIVVVNLEDHILQLKKSKLAILRINILPIDLYRPPDFTFSLRPTTISASLSFIALYSN